MAMSKLRDGLSGREARLLSSLSAKGKRIISVRDIESILECSYDNARRIASDLIKKRWLEKITKGKYLILPLEAGERAVYTEHEFLIASELVHPYYIGFWSALNYHGLTEQMPFTVFVATTQRRARIKIHNTEYRFITLTSEKFFGYLEYSVGDKRVNISDPEKTLIDSLDHPECSGGIEEIAKSLRAARGIISLEKLIGYALKLNDGAVLKRLWYLLDFTGYEIAVKLDSKIRAKLTSGYPLLDPSKPATGKYNNKWMLRMNVSEESMREEAS